MPHESVTHWRSQLKAGNPAAVGPLWARHFPRLVELARARLRDLPRRACDEEDVALGAFDSFCRDVAGGRLPRLDDRDDLWRACCAEPLVLRGHDLKVLGVAFAPDGRLIASAGGDGVAKVWNARSGAELHTLTGHTDRVVGIAIDPAGQHLATASEDQSVSLWNAQTGAELQSFLGHARRVNAVAFAPSGDCLASGSDDGTVMIWKVEDKRRERSANG